MRCPEMLGYLSFSFDLAELRTLAKRNVGIRDRYELGVKQQSGPVQKQALFQQSNVAPDKRANRQAKENVAGIG
jgi:hypothetical protein